MYYYGELDRSNGRRCGSSGTKCRRVSTQTAGSSPPNSEPFFLSSSPFSRSKKPHRLVLFQPNRGVNLHLFSHSTSHAWHHVHCKRLARRKSAAGFRGMIARHVNTDVSFTQVLAKPRFFGFCFGTAEIYRKCNSRERRHRLLSVGSTPNFCGLKDFRCSC